MKKPLKNVIFLSIPICLACYAIASANKNTNSNLYPASYTHFVSPALANGPLKDAASFPIGVGFGTRQLADPNLTQIITREFNSMTTGNSIDWAQISPSPNVFLFDPADKLVNFGLNNGFKVIGHCLVWFKADPAWVQDFQGDADAWDNLMKTHIQTIVSHFKGKVSAWDVVNEGYDENGQHFTDLYYPNLNKHVENVWRVHLGEDYMAKAFTYAHEADPNAVLFYNDYGHERMPKRLQAIVDMANDFKSRNIPIGGIGLQMHLNINVSEDGIKNAFIQLAKTGLQIRISELDIRLNPSGKDDDALTRNAKRQADLYYYVAHAYKTLIPKDQQYGITFWGVSDKDSYVNNPQKVDAPLLFDENYNSKACYDAFISGLQK